MITEHVVWGHQGEQKQCRHNGHAEASKRPNEYQRLCSSLFEIQEVYGKNADIQFKCVSLYILLNLSESIVF